VFIDTYILDALRLDLQHHCVQHLTKKRYFAPLEEPRRAIEIGVGSGIWMLVSVWLHDSKASNRYSFTCRRWLLNFQNVIFSVLISCHYGQPRYCRQIVDLNL
jgi:hypothetical protein